MTNSKVLNLNNEENIEAYKYIPKWHIFTMLFMGLAHGLLGHFLFEKKILANFYFENHIIFLLTFFPFVFYAAYLSLYYRLKTSFKNALWIAAIITSIILITYTFLHPSFIVENKKQNSLPWFLDNYSSNITMHYFYIFTELMFFIGLPLLSGMAIFNKNNMLNTSYYQRLFSISWSNVFSFCIVVILTALSYGLVYLSANLFDLIGIKFMLNLLQDVKWFNYCLVGLLIALSVLLVQYKSNYIHTIRKYWLGLCGFFFYFIVLATIIWLCAIPFTGLRALFATHSTTGIIIAYMLLYIKLLNSVYENGQNIDKLQQDKILKWMPFAACSLLGLWFIGVFALYLRTNQYALTIDRIDGWIVLTILGIYAFGYSLSIFKRKKWLSSLEKTNIVAAICSLVILGVFSLGFIPFKTIIINSQINALFTQKIPINKFDFDYLNRLGNEGLNTLKTLANLKNHPTLSAVQQEEINQKAQNAIQYSNNYNDSLYGTKPQHNQQTQEKEVQTLLNTLPRYAYQASTQNNVAINAPYAPFSMNVQKGFENYFSKTFALLSSCKGDKNNKNLHCILWQANLDANNPKNSQWYLVTKERICGFTDQNTIAPLNYDVSCQIEYQNYDIDFVDGITNNHIILKNSKYFDIVDRRNNKTIHESY